MWSPQCNWSTRQMSRICSKRFLKAANQRCLRRNSQSITCWQPRFGTARLTPAASGPPTQKEDRVFKHLFSVPSAPPGEALDHPLTRSLGLAAAR